MTNHPSAATKSNTVQFASIRIVTDDMTPLVDFYAALTGADPQWLTDDFVELVTPSATVAITHSNRVGFLGVDSPRAASNHSVLYEFLVQDVDDLLSRLQTALDDQLVIVQPITMMPWGNISLMLRDPDGTLVNLYTPVTPDALELQRRRQPQLPDTTSN